MALSSEIKNKKDFNTVINISDVIKELGIDGNIPVIGWVFRDDWAKQNEELLSNFVKASNEAKLNVDF